METAGSGPGRAHERLYRAPAPPASEEERAAFDAAVAMQAEYEADPQVQRRMQAKGISEFTVNGFSASLKGAGELFPGGLSPDAGRCCSAAGLLYRGARLC